MENNIEDLIRDDFREREIQPNTNSFERLSAKLDAQKVKKRKIIIRVLAYAASFIGLIFILQSVFKTNDNTTDKQTITNVKTKDSTETSITEENTSIAVEQIQIKESKGEISSIKKSQKRTVTKETLIANSEEELFSKPLEQMANESKVVEVQSIGKDGIILNDTTRKNQVAIRTIKEVTDEELDALLASANQSLSKNRRDSITINARSMLYEIEVEINKPLPEKVLLTLKTGATTIKELVRPDNKENN
jgi:thiol:disulfide interchange protein